MSYRIEIPGIPVFTLTDSEFEKLSEAIREFREAGFRDGITRWNGITIVECGESPKGEHS